MAAVFEEGDGVAAGIGHTRDGDMDDGAHAGIGREERGEFVERRLAGREDGAASVQADDLGRAFEAAENEDDPAILPDDSGKC